MKAFTDIAPTGYEIRRLLGDGTNGLVYLAVDTQTGQEVALKEFRLGRDSAQRFFRELSLLFTLDHPHLVKCLNFVHEPRGSSFLVLEYASGGSLRRWLADEGRLGEDVVTILARQMAGALECAHRHRVIHCDVKPENILLGGEGNGEQFKLTDLGIAHLVRRDALPLSRGSPAYMAPEQFFDRPVPASDFYGLGIVLFECLEGQVPFQGNHEYLFHAHTREMVDLEGIRSAGWRRLLQAMLDKEPGKRPVTWFEMEALLEDQSAVRRLPVHVSGAKGLKRSWREMGSEVDGSWEEVGHGCLVPGARDLWLPLGEHESQVWVADEKSIDWFDARSGRLRPRELMGRFQAGGVALDGNAHAVVISNELHVYGRGGKRSEVFEVPPGIHAIMELPDGGFWAADGRRVFRLDEMGRIRWESECPSYILPTVLGAAEDGRLLAARGPARPALMEWSADGTEKKIVESGEMILAAGFASKEEKVLCIVQGRSADRACRLMAWEGGVLREVRPLVKGAFAARWLPGGFAIFTAEPLVVIVDEEGAEWVRLKTVGSPVQVVWVPGLPGFVTLARAGSTPVIQRFHHRVGRDREALKEIEYENEL